MNQIDKLPRMTKPPTVQELISLIETKSTQRDNWDSSSHDTDIRFANYHAHQKQWHDWIATADATWLPNLVILTLNPPAVPDDDPAAPDDDENRDIWATDIGEIFGAIAKTNPRLVTDTLLGILNTDGESQAVIAAFHSVGIAIHYRAQVIPGQEEETRALLQKIVAAFTPIVEQLTEKSDDYVLQFIDTLGESIREAGQELLRRITEVVPLERTAVHREVALFLKS